MHHSESQKGSVVIVVAFVAVLVGLLTVSMLMLLTADTEEVQNHRGSVRALAIAEAGIENAIQQLRANASWNAGFSNVVFPAGSSSTYSVTVDNSQYPDVTLVGTSQVDGFTRQLTVTVVVSGPPTPAPYPVRIKSWRET